MIEITYNMTFLFVFFFFVIWGIEPINKRFLRKARILQFLPVEVSMKAEENRKNIILRSGIDFLWLNICLLSLIFTVCCRHCLILFDV